MDQGSCSRSKRPKVVSILKRVRAKILHGGGSATNSNASSEMSEMKSSLLAKTFCLVSMARYSYKMSVDWLSELVPKMLWVSIDSIDSVVFTVLVFIFLLVVYG